MQGQNRMSCTDIKKNPRFTTRTKIYIFKIYVRLIRHGKVTAMFQRLQVFTPTL